MPVVPFTVGHMTSTWTETLGVFDLETTGVDIETARIVTAHVGVLDAEGRQIESWSWMADPGVEIPAGATAVHGVTTERARLEGRPAGVVVAEIVDCLTRLFARGLAVTIYNAPYDLSLLDREATRHGVTPLVCGPIIDPLVLDKAVDRYRRGKRTLTAATEHYGVVLDDAHDARSDAVAAGRVAQAIARRYPVETLVDLAVLHDMQTGWCRDQAESFQEYMRRVRDPEFVADGAWPVRPALAPAVLGEGVAA
jgi:DNA polymerase-3 subunit epsilon